MNKIKVSLIELFNVLKTIELTFKKEQPILMVNISSKPRKGKNKKLNKSYKAKVEKPKRGA